MKSTKRPLLVAQRALIEHIAYIAGCNPGNLAEKGSVRTIVQNDGNALLND